MKSTLNALIGLTFLLTVGGSTPFQFNGIQHLFDDFINMTPDSEKPALDKQYQRQRQLVGNKIGNFDKQNVYFV